MRRGSAVGLDIGASCVRAAEVVLRASGPTLVRFGQVALPTGAVEAGAVRQPEVVTAAIRSLWAATALPRRPVRLGVGNPGVVVRALDLPFYRSRDELRSALPYLVGDQVPMDDGETVIDFAPLEEVISSDGTRQLSGLLVAGSEATIACSVDCVLAAGLRVASVDLNPLALLRAAVPTPGLGLRARPEAIVDVGAELTSVVVHEDGMPRLVRILAMGGAAVSRALVAELQLSAPQAEAAKRELAGPAPAPDVARTAARITQDMVGEIRGSLDYFGATSPTGPVTRVVLTGGGSRMAGLAPALGDGLRVPVERGSGFVGVDVSGSGLTEAQLVYVDPLAPVAVGLAMGAAA